jgi:hypothetical protein
MKFIITFLLFSNSLWAQNFNGHLTYKISYSRPYSSGPVPFYKKLDLYIRDNKKLFILEVFPSPKISVKAGYLFDDAASTLTNISYARKAYLTIPYSRLPSLNIVGDSSRLGSSKKFKGQMFFSKNFIDTSSKSRYQIWYSGMKTTPTKAQKVDLEKIIDSSGHIAFSFEKQILPDTFAIFDIESSNSDVSESIFEIPAGFKQEK